MKVIDQKIFADISVYTIRDIMSLDQDGEEISIDTIGAKQLIKVLQEFINENQD